jgi:hypothetical protein
MGMQEVAVQSYCFREGDVDPPVSALSECVGNIKKELSNG